MTVKKIEDNAVCYLQAIVNNWKWAREEGFRELDKEWQSDYEAAANVVKVITGKEPVIRSWKVSLED